MCRLFSVLLLLTAVALAAPVPKQSDKQKLEAKFGKIADSKGDSKFALDGDKLLITLPAKETRSYGHTTDPDDPANQAKFKKTNTCPRVDFEAKGDFVLTVRVGLNLDTKAKAITEGQDFTFVNGGIQVMCGKDNWISFGPTQSMLSGKVSKDYTFEMPGVFSEGLGATVSERTPVPDEVWLQLMRVRNTLNFSTSTDDGATYSVKFTSANGPKDDTLRLALVAQHSSNTAHTVTFDQFKVEPVKR